MRRIYGNEKSPSTRRSRTPVSPAYVPSEDDANVVDMGGLHASVTILTQRSRQESAWPTGGVCGGRRPAAGSVSRQAIGHLENLIAKFIVRLVTLNQTVVERIGQGAVLREIEQPGLLHRLDLGQVA